MTAVAVVRTFGEHHVVAMAPFAAGDRLLVIEGEVVDRPSKYSLQVDDERHIEIPAGAAARFMNHSCAPSVAVRGREVFALRDLASGDEITFDYNTTEYEMDAPFICRGTCCDGREIGGFGQLDPAEQERLRPLLAAHLLRRLA